MATVDLKTLAGPSLGQLTAVVGSDAVPAYRGSAGSQSLGWLALDVTQQGLLRLGLRAALSASGTSVAFTGIPSQATRLTLTLESFTNNAGGTAAIPVIQLGTGGGYETVGYVTSAGSIKPDSTILSSGAVTNGWRVVAAGSLWAGGTTFMYGQLGISLYYGTQNRWAAHGNFAGNDGLMTAVGGTIGLSSALTSLRILTSGGTATFSGIVGLLVE